MNTQLLCVTLPSYLCDLTHRACIWIRCSSWEKQYGIYRFTLDKKKIVDYLGRKQPPRKRREPSKRKIFRDCLTMERILSSFLG